MFNTIIIDNFFDNFELLEHEFKKIPLLSFSENKQVTEGVKWPGKRSLHLGKTHPFIWQLTNKEIQQKSGNERLMYSRWRMSVNTHLRLSEDEKPDYIHTDPDDITMIVFLSKTNLKSGLSIYDENKQETQNIKFVQNRAVLFDGKQFHRSSLNYGDNIDNGRLTLNCFINFL